MSDSTASAEQDGWVYQPIFVGREPEIQQLRLAFAAAAEGQGGLVTLVGEPGIGKTALWQQLTDYVQQVGGRVLVGNCNEEGQRSLPYQPFVEALQTCVREYESDALIVDLGYGAADAARIVPEILERLNIALRPAGTPEEDRWRLLQAVAGFLDSAAGRQPLLLVLEDLQDADRATLDLLVHVSRRLATMRILTIGTYRDVEVDREHPLSSTLAELRRSPHFRRMQLRGLSLDEVQRLCSRFGGAPVRWIQAEVIHRRTEGNPLFVQEVLRYVADLERRTGEQSPGARAVVVISDDDFPEGLRDIVGQRLNRLSSTTNQLLSTAAVIGREFRLDILERVANLPEDDLHRALEQAQRHAIIEEHDVAGGPLTFRFCHAFFRQALHAELFAPRRVRLHQRVALILEEVYAGHEEEHAGELADHFAQSGLSTDLAKAVGYAELAARRAMSVFAYAQAEHYLKRALSAQELIDPDNAIRRCDLLLALGESVLPQDEPHRVTESIATEAFALAVSRGDAGRAAKAAVQALEPLSRVRTVARPAEIAEFREWVTRLDQYARSGTPERIHADIWLGVQSLNTPGEISTGRAHLLRALSQALELGDEPARLNATGWAMSLLQGVRDVELVEGLAQQLLTSSRAGIGAGVFSHFLFNLAERLFSTGHRASANEAWNELARLAAHTHDATVATRHLEAKGALAYIDGDLERAVELHDEAARKLQDLGGAETGGRYAGFIRTLFHLGHLAPEHLRPLEQGVSGLSNTRQIRVVRALTLAFLGSYDEAREIQAQFPDAGSADDESAIFNLVCLLEVAIRCGDESIASRLVNKLSPLATRVSRSVSYGRVLGGAATMLGRPEEALQFYREALKVCHNASFKPEVALIHLELAELLTNLTPDNRRQAKAHLDAATEQFGAMRMRHDLERARRLATSGALDRQSAGPSVADTAPTTTRREVSESNAPDLRVLTPRELEVVHLLTRGLSNRAIAESLVISETTAEVHVKHILSKLGFKSRAQIAAWATRQTLLT
jgi:DNA-binding CsgD family transcriptional regulator/tetratricopeptide (TPR) repeat protein